MNKRSLFSSAYFSIRAYILLSALALFLGGFIYILFRPSGHLFFKWISSVGLGGWFNYLRSHSLLQSLHIPDWIIFSLPNALWAFAYAMLVTRIWFGSKSWLRYFWMASILLLVIGFELLQYTGTIRGTYCIQDLMMGLAGLIAGIIIGLKLIKTNSHEKTTKN